MMKPFQPVKTKAQRQAESRVAHEAYLQRKEQEYCRQLSLPSLEDKVQAIADAVVTLLAVIGHQARTGEPIDPLKIDDVAEELLRVTNQETRNI